MSQLLSDLSRFMQERVDVLLDCIFGTEIKLSLCMPGSLTNSSSRSIFDVLFTSQHLRSYACYATVHKCHQQMHWEMSWDSLRPCQPLEMYLTTLSMARQINGVDFAYDLA